MKKYRVRWEGYSDDRCADVTASSPQHAAEVFVECSSREHYDGRDYEVVVFDGKRRRNVVVTVALSWNFEASCPRELQKEPW